MREEQPKTKSVLVVEDNEIIREGLTTILRDAGYAVKTASNGQEALSQLRTSPAPDLILLDMLMPVLDGWHFLQRLGKERQTPRVPIIITTGTNLTLEWALDHGCQGFIRKPIDSSALLTEVRRCFGEADLPRA